MKLLSLLGDLLGAFFKSLFCKSAEERAGAAEEQVKQLKSENAVRAAMQRADYPTTDDELEKTLRDGKL